MASSSTQPGANMQFDHVTIVTADIDGTRRFFDEVAGLDTGKRPPFRVDGYWLYLSGRPYIHITRSTLPGYEGRTAPRIDHIALRVDGRDEWSTLLSRMHAYGIEYDLSVVPLTNETQLCVSLAPGVKVEFIAALTS